MAAHHALPVPMRAMPHASWHPMLLVRASTSVMCARLRLLRAPPPVHHAPAAPQQSRAPARRPQDTMERELAQVVGVSWYMWAIIVIHVLVPHSVRIYTW